MSDFKFLERWKLRAKQLRVKTYALYLAYKDPRTPLYAKVFAACIVGYAFSPIDLIPDFIPILGYLDDVVLIPLGIVLAFKMIPETVIQECEEKARTALMQDPPRSRTAAVVIITIWFLLMALFLLFILKVINNVTSDI